MRQKCNDRKQAMLFPTPEEHAENPPETWRVQKIKDNLWSLNTKDGTRLQTEKTMKAAEAHKTQGFYFNLYQDETRWYKGEQVRNWKPYSSQNQGT